MIHLDRKRRLSLYAAGSGMLMVLASPPAPLGFLAWFGLVPLFLAIEQVEDRAEAFRVGFTFGLVWHAATLYWIAWNSGVIWPLAILSAMGLVAILGLWMGLVAVLHRLLLRAFGRIGHLLVVVVWMGSDVFWQAGDWHFPWITLAFTQGKNLELLQMLSIGGAVTMTGYVALLNGILTYSGRRIHSVVIVLILLVVPWLWGAERIERVEQASEGRTLVTAEIVQGNIEAGFKYTLSPWYSLNIYEALTRANTADSVDLVVWPETAAPVYVKQDYKFRTYFQELVDDIDATLITGGRMADFDSTGRTPYNAAFLIEPGSRRRFQAYQKVLLVPVGERFPFQWLFPILGTVDFGQAEFRPGPGIKVWPMKQESDTIGVSPLICYEAIFSKAGRKAVQKDADLLVNMTNDGWFTGTGQQQQHLLLSRMRSIETGRAMIRSTNTGISAFIRPSGIIEKTLGPGLRGTIVSNVPPPVETTFSGGGWMVTRLSPILTILLVTVAGILYVIRRGSGSIPSHPSKRRAGLKLIGLMVLVGMVMAGMQPAYAEKPGVKLTGVHDTRRGNSTELVIGRGSDQLPSFSRQDLTAEYDNKLFMSSATIIESRLRGSTIQELSSLSRDAKHSILSSRAMPSVSTRPWQNSLQAQVEDDAMDSSYWRFLIPVAVTVAVGVTTYLLFTVRSG